MTTKEKTKQYKITVTQHYWVKKESVNFVEGENIDTAMKQVEQGYDEEVLSWDTVSKHHEGVDWAIETLDEDESTDE